MKLLIAVGDVASDASEVPESVRLLIDGASNILVMSPSLVSRIDWLTGDVDRARHETDERVAAVVGQLETPGKTVKGIRGDELVRSAFDDAIRSFVPDHIVIALRAAETKAWQRKGLLEHLLEVHRLPVTTFVIRHAPHPA
jgi:hypothetical protein